MKVLICWSHISGYMSACWRRLAQSDDVSLRIMAWRGSGGAIDFSHDLLAGLDAKLASEEQPFTFEQLLAEARDFQPDAVVIVGWMNDAYVRLALSEAFSNAAVVMTMDTPLRLGVRPVLARAKLRKLVSRLDGVVVAGERAYQYARFIGVPDSAILRGLYGYDDELFRPVAEARGNEPVPGFLYVGRYVRQKSLDVLLDAYARYRAGREEPWPLVCCGKGPLAEAVGAAEGVTDLGFVQPADLPGVLGRSGVFVFPSSYEPWGVALAEAMASGMPAIATEAVGSALDLLRGHHNGLWVPPGDASRLADALAWTHANAHRQREMGRAARESAVAFSAERWAERWRDMLARLVRG